MPIDSRENKIRKTKATKKLAKKRAEAEAAPAKKPAPAKAEKK